VHVRIGWLLFGTLLTTAAWAGPRRDLRKGQALYDKGRYAEVVERLEDAEVQSERLSSEERARMLSLLGRARLMQARLKLREAEWADLVRLAAPAVEPLVQARDLRVGQSSTWAQEALDQVAPRLCRSADQAFDKALAEGSDPEAVQPLARLCMRAAPGSLWARLVAAREAIATGDPRAVPLVRTALDTLAEAPSVEPAQLLSAAELAQRLDLQVLLTLEDAPWRERQRGIERLTLNLQALEPHLGGLSTQAERDAFAQRIWMLRVSRWTWMDLGPESRGQLIAELRAHMRDHPGDHRVVPYLAQALGKQGRHEQAVEVVRAHLKHSDDPLASKAILGGVLVQLAEHLQAGLDAPGADRAAIASRVQALTREAEPLLRDAHEQGVLCSCAEDLARIGTLRGDEEMQRRWSRQVEE